MKKIFTAFLIIATLQTLIEQGSSDETIYCSVYRLIDSPEHFPTSEFPKILSFEDIPECNTFSVIELIKLVETSTAFTISMYFKPANDYTWPSSTSFLFQLTNSDTE